MAVFYSAEVAWSETQYSGWSQLFTVWPAFLQIKREKKSLLCVLAVGVNSGSHPVNLVFEKKKKSATDNEMWQLTSERGTIKI